MARFRKTAELKAEAQTAEVGDAGDVQQTMDSFRKVRKPIFF